MRNLFLKFVGIAGLVLTIFCLWFYFYVVAVYPQGHWWQEIGNDIDGIHATTTIGLLNNSDYRYVFHPAATVFNLHGSTERFLRIFSSKHDALFHFEKLNDDNNVAALIETATRTARWLTFFVTIALAVVLFLFLMMLTKNVLITSAMTFYVMTSRGHLEHLTMVRAEVYSIFFVLLAGLTFALIIKKFNDHKIADAAWVFVGMFSIFAILSKIQILPAVLLLFLFILYFAIKIPVRGKDDVQNILVLWIINVVFMPWWALRCPAEFRGNNPVVFNAHDDLRHVYGSFPIDNFYALPIIVLFALLILLVIGIEKGRPRFIFISKIGLLITLGIVLAVYGILAPVSGSISKYFSNTQHLIYATLSNISGGGFLQNRVFGWETITSVVQRLYFGDLWFVPMRWIVVGLGFVLLSHLVVDKKNRMVWVFILSWFFLAFAMDCLATMRSKSYYSYYFIYTITFYGIGIALAINEILSRWKSMAWMPIIKIALCLFFCVYVGWRIEYFIKKELVCQYKPSDPAKEWQSLHSQTEPFWTEVYKKSGIRK